MTAADLHSRACRVAHQMDRLEIPARGVVGIALYSGPALHAAWLGCLWSGRIPSMVAPPSPRMEPAKYAAGLSGIVSHLGISAMLVDETAANLLAGRLDCPVPLIDAGNAGGTCPDYPCTDIGDDEVAVVQHSSGTTGVQKAIALTTRQVMAHHHAYAWRIGLTARDRIISWLPLYHDMGFVAAFLLPMIAGLEVIELSPFQWANRPGELLTAIDEFRPTLCWMPNFAFALLSERRVLDQAGSADLSSIRGWISSSEPVMASSIDRFVAALGACGATHDQIFTSYAMAENVFAVTQSEPGDTRVIRVNRDLMLREQMIKLADSGDRDAIQLVSNGTPLPTTELQVRDADGHNLPDGHIGEFHMRGSHRFSGYLNRPELNRQVIDANGWYATGDLGCLLNGHAYVTSRKKDIVIVRGRNYYCHDIEEIAASVEGVKRGRVVAFGVPDEKSGTEKLIVLAEAEDGFENRTGGIILNIRNRISQALDTTASDVRIVPARWLVKSTAGKLARADNLKKYLDVVAQPAHV